MLKDPPHRTGQEKMEISHLVFGEKTKVKYANFDGELIGEDKSQNKITINSR
jgi:hypothetical protein